jgi:RimJ/RimL family protein N-acetyltransferase
MLRTERLQLRPWRDQDLPAFAALNADPRVMEFFLNPLDRAESDATVRRISENLTRQGFGIWAVEAFGVAEFIGAVGLSVPRYETHFTPCVEILWRLAYEYWGCGYATEAARLALDYGFRTAGLRQIVAYTYEGNLRSRKVMERLGMRYSLEDDFDHPLVPAGHRLRRHVLYRLDGEVYLSAGS